MLYTYCKESLSFRKVTPTRKLGIVALVIFAGIYLSMTSMVTNAKQQAYKEAFNLPAETELVILDTTEDQFTQGQLVEELKRLNVRYPYIVLAQSILETGYWESRIYQENNNCTVS